MISAVYIGVDGDAMKVVREAEGLQCGSIISSSVWKGECMTGRIVEP